MRGGNPLGKVLDHPWWVVGAVVSAALIYWVIGTRHQEHYLKASFPSAFNFVPGQDIRISGQDVGKTGKIKYEDGHAVVDIGIDDEDYWPMKAGTRAIQHYGTTIGSGTRYIELIPGPDSGRDLKEDEIIGFNYTKQVPDVDEILNVFTKQRRATTQSLVTRIDEGIKGPDLNAALKPVGPGVNAASDFLRNLGSDNEALRAFITKTHRAMGILGARPGEVSDVITGAASVFGELGKNASSFEQTFVEGAPTFRETRNTLQRVDRSVDVLDELITDLGPGAKQLPPLARAATPALSQLRATVPSALSTVRSIRRASPRIRRLLTTGTPFVTRLGTTSEQLAPMVACIRPYAPEASGTITGLTGWTQNYGEYNDDFAGAKLANNPPRYYQAPKSSDGRFQVHSLRALPIVSARSLDSYPSAVNSELFSKLTGTAFAYPRPPGLAAAQPWFQPECGVGPEGLDAANDPDDQK